MSDKQLKNQSKERYFWHFHESINFLHPRIHFSGYMITSADRSGWKWKTRIWGRVMILREINRSDKKPTDLKAKNSLPGVIIIRILSQLQVPDIISAGCNQKSHYAAWKLTGFQGGIHVAHPPLPCFLPFGSILLVLALPQKRQTSPQPAPRLA